MSALRNSFVKLHTKKHERHARRLLTRAPHVVSYCEMTIRNRLLNARFRDGLEYLEIELTDLRRERGADGDKSLRMEVGAARGRMEHIALELPAARY